MAEYLEPKVAQNESGLRLVLTTGVPGPWGEAAKSIFYVKKIPYQRVRQEAGLPNEDLVAWTGTANAPQAVLDEEPSRSGWAEILLLAERLSEKPRLIPSDPHDRALCFGLSFEICGEDGFGWNRRLQLLHPMLSMPDAESNPALAAPRRLGARYGYSASRAAAADRRVCEILQLLSEQLAAQKAKGSAFLVGDALSAVDLYWSTFAAMLKPLPEELCPMSEMLRGAYGTLTPAIEAAVDGALLEHRDRIYAEFLELPLEL